MKTRSKAIAHRARWIRTALPLGVLLQITACTGPDPQFFLLSTAASTTVSVVVARLVDALISGLISPA